MRYPSIKTLAAELRLINDNIEYETDIRLQVIAARGNRAQWMVHTGLSDYDQDHSGVWGASSLPGYRRSKFDAESIARELLDQAREMEAQS